MRERSGSVSTWGLSPRGWGNPHAMAGQHVPMRSIPAWVGEPLRATQLSLHRTVYPRVGGGTVGAGPTLLRHRGLSPQTRAVGATFLRRVPLPARFNGKYDPADRPSSTPTLLKPGDRRRFTKPGKTKPKSEPNPRPPRKVLPPKVKRTPERQREREGPRQRPPEYREASKKAAKDWRERAKELGICRDCREQAIPNQTRC